MNDILFSPISLSDLEKVIQNAIKSELESRSNFKNKEYLTRTEAAEMLDISLVTLCKHLKDGDIPRYYAGSRVRIKLDDVKKFYTLKKTRKKNKPKP